MIYLSHQAYWFLCFYQGGCRAPHFALIINGQKDSHVDAGPYKARYAACDEVRSAWSGISLAEVYDAHCDTESRNEYREDHKAGVDPGLGNVLCGLLYLLVLLVGLLILILLLRLLIGRVLLNRLCCSLDSSAAGAVY